MYPFLLLSLVSPGLEPVQPETQVGGVRETSQEGLELRLEERRGLSWGYSTGPRDPEGPTILREGSFVCNRRTWDPWRLGKRPGALPLPRFSHQLPQNTDTVTESEQVTA